MWPAGSDAADGISYRGRTGDGLLVKARLSRAIFRTAFGAPEPSCHRPRTIAAARLAPVPAGARQLAPRREAGRPDPRLISIVRAAAHRGARLNLTFLARAQAGSRSRSSVLSNRGPRPPRLARALRSVPADSRWPQGVRKHRSLVNLPPGTCDRRTTRAPRTPPQGPAVWPQSSLGRRRTRGRRDLCRAGTVFSCRMSRIPPVTTRPRGRRAFNIIASGRFRILRLCMFTNKTGFSRFQARPKASLTSENRPFWTVGGGGRR